MTFWHDIAYMTDGQLIEAVIIQKPKDYEYGEWPERIPHDRCGVVLNAEEAAKLLSYEYDEGYGSRDCHAVYVYTPHRIIFVHEYDGSTSVVWVPRHPDPSVEVTDL